MTRYSFVTRLAAVAASATLLVWFGLLPGCGGLFPWLECTTDDDCREGEVCEDGVCVCAPCVECTTDADCCPGEICDDGVCVEAPGPECTINDDCAEGEVCDDGVCVEAPVGPADTFPTSLHDSNFRGMETFYSAANGGFETVTNVAYDDLACKVCHDKSRFENADPPVDWPGTESCANCHANLADPSEGIDDSLCLGCHGRQKAEAGMFDDVHRTKGMACTACHGSVAMHGDGTEYSSFLDPDYPQVACEDCHEGDAAPPATVLEHSTHVGQLDCSACHMQSVLSCYNCHFDSELAVDNNKRAFAPISNFVFLVNREGKNKVYGATFQSLVNEREKFVAFAPYYAHTITDQGRICADCHANFGGSIAAIQEYNATGTITVATWDDTAEGAARLAPMSGVIPVPEDWEDAFQFAWLDYTGDPTTPAAESDPTLWVNYDAGPAEGTQMLYATPLTAAQMAKIGASAP